MEGWQKKQLVGMGAGAPEGEGEVTTTAPSSIMPVYPVPSECGDVKGLIENSSIKLFPMHPASDVSSDKVSPSKIYSSRRVDGRRQLTMRARVSFPIPGRRIVGLGTEKQLVRCGSIRATVSLGILCQLSVPSPMIRTSSFTGERPRADNKVETFSSWLLFFRKNLLIRGLEDTPSGTAGTG